MNNAKEDEESDFTTNIKIMIMVMMSMTMRRVMIRKRSNKQLCRRKGRDAVDDEDVYRG